MSYFIYGIRYLCFFIKILEGEIMSRAMVYKLISKGEKNGVKTYGLSPYQPYFNTPPKLYGKMWERAKHFFKTYTKEVEGIGIMLTGIHGTGKTETGKVLANLVIDAGIPVVYVTNLVSDVELLNYLDSLPECCIFIDEFGKQFNINFQNKMLTLLSGVNKGKKLVLITENEINNISKYILSLY